jgi:hypothetical protein
MRPKSLTSPVAPDKSVAPSHLPTMAGAMSVNFWSRSAFGERTMIETPIWCNRLVALWLTDATNKNDAICW